MGLKIEKYVRKPFAVEAVEVTKDNIREVAKWCGGRVQRHRRRDYGYREGYDEYVKVEVRKPLNERQTRAYYGDWVLAAEQNEGSSFKVYTKQAFEGSFQKHVEDMMATVERMEKREANEARQEEELDFSEGTSDRTVVFTNSIH